MQDEEFERRKRRLEEQLQEGIELLKAGFRQQLRALELVWMTTAEEDEIPPQIPAETAWDAPALPVETAVAAPQAATSSRPRLKRGQLWEEIEAALDSVPRVFDRHDLVRVLGYEPERTGLHRVMQALLEQGVITLKRRGFGRIPTQYQLAGGEEKNKEAGP